MDDPNKLAQALVNNPSESLDTELKDWLDLGTPEHKAKLVKAALALYNHGGGQILIGFDDKTRSPTKIPANYDAATMFHPDDVQKLVSGYASTLFGVQVVWAERNGQQHPVIFVPGGVRAPVVCKKDFDSGPTKLLRQDVVYVRTNRANHSASSAQASGKDWERLFEVCFDNREADIGRFIRRHLGSVTPESLTDLVNALSSARIPAATSGQDAVRALLDAGAERLAARAAERGATLPALGAWSAACVVEGVAGEHHADGPFLQLLDSIHPRYTGWPIWKPRPDSDREQDHPVVVDDRWEMLAGDGENLEFAWWDPKGRFYLRRVLDDDTAGKSRGIAQGSALDPGLATVRCAEALAVLLTFARGLDFPADTTVLHVAFRWEPLKGRRLTSWAPGGPTNYRVMGGRIAVQDTVTATGQVPLSIAPQAIGSALAPILAQLFRVFDGHVVPQEVIEAEVKWLLDRR